MNRLSGLYGELLTIIVVGGIVLLFVAVGLWRYAGTASPEIGQVVRFGLASSEKGSWPLVIVRAGDGRQYQLYARPVMISGCKIGDPIRLIRRLHSLQVDPRGCRHPAPPPVMVP